MRIPDGYRQLKSLRATAHSEVALARRESDGLEVILKTYLEPGPGDERLRAELAAFRAVEGPGVPRALALLESDQAPILVLELVPGTSIHTWTGRGHAGPLAFADIALQLACILERVHAAHLIHRDISAHNVLVDPVTLRTHLIDFGLAQRLGRDSRPAAPRPQGPAGTLHFLAPEQTGRMNR